jgi:metal-responsive CopG/Arc/MetJ family transcriptional regulator
MYPENTGGNTMAYRKTAIAVPGDILEEVDRAARERGESRSRFISRVLRLAVRARRDAEVTRRLDALFADESVREEQRREAQDLAQVGINWDSERW